MKRSECYEVELAALDPRGGLREEAEHLGFHGIPAYPLTSFYDWNMAVQLRRFAAWLRDRRIALIHTHDFYSNVFGMAAAKLAGVPVRVASRRELGGMRTPSQLWVERRAYGFAHKVVGNSEAVQQQLWREGIPRNKTTVIYNGLDVERFAQSSRVPRAQVLQSLGLPGEARCLVTIVANFRHDVKDHPTFLRAAQRVRQAIPEARFVLAGEGELLEPMRALASHLGIADATLFLGGCPHVAELLAASDVCVLTSRFEGFPNAILEYMAAERPVVATDVGGVHEAVIEGATGFLVLAGDDGAMAERIIRLLWNPQQARVMGERGRQIVSERFSCSAQLRHTEDLYASLLQSRMEFVEAAE